MIGKTISHYEITDKLGSGGMGDVYRARDTKLGRDVAIKFLPEEMARDTERRKRFEREARAIAALKHPNIVTIYTVEEAAGRHFITMELVEGQSLRDVIPSGGLTLERLFDLAIPLADAISSA
ncbi:MAG: serine/threonine-protein kinase, partial [Candidatus Krumholzibacteria bacterium]